MEFREFFLYVRRRLAIGKISGNSAIFYRPKCLVTCNHFYLLSTSPIKFNPFFKILKVFMSFTIEIESIKTDSRGDLEILVGWLCPNENCSAHKKLLAIVNSLEQCFSCKHRKPEHILLFKDRKTWPNGI